MSDNNKKDVGELKKALRALDQGEGSSCVLCKLTLIISIILFIVVIVFVTVATTNPSYLSRLSQMLGFSGGQGTMTPLSYTSPSVSPEQSDAILNELTQAHEAYVRNFDSTTPVRPEVKAIKSDSQNGLPSLPEHRSNIQKN